VVKPEFEAICSKEECISTLFLIKLNVLDNCSHA
jgi:hypothetical protein